MKELEREKRWIHMGCSVASCRSSTSSEASDLGARNQEDLDFPPHTDSPLPAPALAAVCLAVLSSCDL